MNIKLGEISSQQQILDLMRKAFLEIRFQSRSEHCDIKTIGLLSDLFHNVPLALLSDHINNDDLLEQIIQRSQSNKGLYNWVISNLKD